MVVEMKKAPITNGDGEISALYASKMVPAYAKMDESEKAAYRRNQLLRIVRYAKAHSPLYADLYAGLDDDFKLSDLPVTTKNELKERFDDWVTDRSVTMDGIMEYIKDQNNNGKLFLGKYLVFRTSGSTGSPAVTLYDRGMIHVSNALDWERGFPTLQVRNQYFRRRCKFATVCANPGFNLGSGMLIYGKSVNIIKRFGSKLFDIFDPLPELVAELNRFSPAMFSGYPSAMTVLAKEQLAGRLHISPLLVVSCGEYLSDDSKKTLEAAFGRRPINAYLSTESGSVASECPFGHMHVNDDWVVMEPVDRENRPVATGRADKWLLTTMGNFIQPYIRYEVTDRIVYHDEGCPCGRTSPWVEVEGRTDDTLRFRGKDGEVEIIPWLIYIVLTNMPEVRSFQALLHDENRLELRIAADDRVSTFEKAKAVVDETLAKHGVRAHIYLSDTPPGPDKSGKFIHVRNALKSEPQP
ncbi:MAG: phenylacetate--CoA ligase family protein [Clostridiales bacterium]|jgi:phenylacetate-coenzyme A ligase PaaK-like adenylate-forming protein|nr:phenylacetate--CoA ligase family protein [Clostridiales bacterium]